MTRFDVARTQQPKSTAAYGSLRFGPLRYQLKRTIGMLPTPDNSECSRQTWTLIWRIWSPTWTAPGRQHWRLWKKFSTRPPCGTWPRAMAWTPGQLFNLSAENCKGMQTALLP
ncbi:hypothetical protein [Tateyamaria sp.]|uniref:hypothetical protein n=1 Tax=Tateyamaria sp. TaxID=1929288 RepID=UPI003B217E59